MPTPNHSRLIVALDQFTCWDDDMKDFIALLATEVAYFKIGMRAFFGGGFELLQEMKHANAKVFLDLKLLDIPNTVAAALSTLETQHTGVVLATIHMQGQGMKEALGRAGLQRLKVLMVTVLTSEAAGSDVADKVVGMASEAQQLGCAGVICSPLEAKRVRQRTGDAFLIVCPGVRPDWSVVAQDDQQRVTTPAQAIQNGADYVVVGRPIYQSSRPLEVAQRMNREIDAVLPASTNQARQESVAPAYA